MRVAILDDIHKAYEVTDGVRRLRERVEVRIFTGPFGDPSVLSRFDALIANRERTRFTRELFEQLPNLRIIAQTGTHVNHIDLPAAAESGIVVGKAAAGHSYGTVELAVGLMIAVVRQIPAHDRAVRGGVWSTPLTPALHGKTLGIVGFGRIGQHVAEVGRILGMRVLAWGPRLTDATAKEAGVESQALDDLLKYSDVVSVHAALTAESRGLIDARRVGLMKASAYLVNTARGPIVDETALVEALTEGRIAGAGLDVFDQEPLPAGHPLTRLSNVVLTPHMGWTTDFRYGLFAEGAADLLLAYLDGEDVPRFTA
jgi:phosphoglycerate dehydrogenase-like enzyme